MDANVAKILQEAMKLAPEARAAIAGSLLESLEEPFDEAIEESWAIEIAKRIREIDAGKVATVPWSEARRKIVGE